MDKALVEMITKLVTERLQQEQEIPTQKKAVQIPDSNEPFIELFQQQKPSSAKSHDTAQTIQPNNAKHFEETFDEKYANARSKTPARIGVGRTGPRPLTNTMVKFRFDHAAAVDTVYGEVEQALLDKMQLFTIDTKALNEKETYILRPDLGRKLTDAAKETLLQKCEKNAQVQIIVSNGLSASAINTNLENVLLSLQQSLTSLQLKMGTPFYIEQGRVGLMDDIGELLQPEVIVYLIGERPGLVSAESMSAYLCYKPRKDTIESDRTVVSNIHKGGIPPVEAGAYLGNLIQKILKYEASGVTLVQKEE